jgi:hypothetical protein
MTDMICEKKIDKSVLPLEKKLETINEKINLDNMSISQLMKELEYYTEEEYNTYTKINKESYDNIITIHMKTLSAIKSSLDTRTHHTDTALYAFIEVNHILQELIDEHIKYKGLFNYPFPDIVDISYKKYCKRKEKDIMKNPKLSPLLQKIKKIKKNKNIHHTIECEI